MKSPSFLYVRPDSFDAVFTLLAEYGNEAKIIAGGQSLLPSLNMRLSAPAVLIDIYLLRELKEIKEVKGTNASQDTLQVGALVKHCEIESSSLIASYAPLLHQALPHVAHRAVRSRGTFGGSIAFADAASETPAMTLAHEATLVLRSASGERRVRVDDFFLGLYETAIQTNEMLVRAEFNKPPPRQRYVFREIMRRKGDYATVGLGISGQIDQGVCQDLRIVYFAIADKPLVSTRVVELLRHKKLDTAEIDFAVNCLEEDIQAYGDTYHDEHTKMHLMRVLLKRSLLEFIQLEPAPKKGTKNV